MGRPAARVGDNHACPVIQGLKPHTGGAILEGSPDVFICGMPAARLGDKLSCNGAPDTIAEGEPTVFINGRPAARMGDLTAHGGVISEGCSTVLIGTGKTARCLEGAAASGNPLVALEG